MTNAATALKAYDDQLRLEAEIIGASSHDLDGPLLRAVFGSRGFVTYRNLDGIRGSALDDLISATVAHFRDHTAVVSFEWKTRGHDQPPDLARRLLAHGLHADETETVMVGEAALLAVDKPRPDNVVVREVGATGDLAGDAAGMVALHHTVYGPHRGPSVEDLLSSIDNDPGNRWIITSGLDVVAAGRLSVVPDTEFAGLWGGATHPDWRGRGLYNSLLTVRARAAVDQGVHYLQSDCTAMSRPILERSGLIAITTTTPYLWTRPAN